MFKPAILKSTPNHTANSQKMVHTEYFGTYFGKREKPKEDQKATQSSSRVHGDDYDEPTYMQAALTFLALMVP